MGDWIHWVYARLQSCSVDATFIILLVGSLYICIIHRHLLEVISHVHCCIHAVYPSRYHLEALCHYNNVTSYIVFLTSYSCSAYLELWAHTCFFLANVTG